MRIKFIPVFISLFLMLASAALAGDGKVHKRVNAVPGSYIVLLDPAVKDVKSVAAALTKKYGGHVKFVYNNVGGFSMKASAAAAARIAAAPRVAGVEQDGYASVSSTQVIPSTTESYVIRNNQYIIDTISVRPQWWLDRADQLTWADPPFDYAYHWAEDGTGVRVYVIDTGIDWRSKEFSKIQGTTPVIPADTRIDRAESLHALFPGFQRPEEVPGNCAAAAHGTAVASLIGGWTYGIAKGVTLVDAQAQQNGCVGQFQISDIITALNWIPSDPNNASHRPAIVNMSLETTSANPDPGFTLNQTVNRLANDYGLIFFVGAGNFAKDAWSVEPAGATSAIAVGALDNTGDHDTAWSMSNFGPKVRYWAPGVGINAAAKRDTANNAETTRAQTDDCGVYNDPSGFYCLSGTSFAAPQAAGMGSIILQRLFAAGITTPTADNVMYGTATVAGLDAYADTLVAPPGSGIQSYVVNGERVLQGSIFHIRRPNAPPWSNLTIRKDALWSSENSGSASLTIDRGGDTSGAASVTFTTSDGSATAGVRYTTTTTTVNFAAGEISKTVAVPLINTSTAEGNQTFTATLSSPSNASLGLTSVATVTVVDDDTVNSDFTAVVDRKRDIVWRNTGTGQTRVWFMNNTTLTGATTLTDTNSQTLVGVADFNGDGHADLLWRNATDGSMTVWYMNGTTLVSTGDMLSLSSPDWVVAAVGDLNHDGFPDILWRHRTTFQAIVWLMRDRTFVDAASLPTVADANWQIIGIGDFNRDKKNDIVWRHSSGIVAVWLMNDTTFTTSVNVATVGAPWVLVGVGDMTGDGDADLIWQTTTTRQVAVWQMNQTALQSAFFVDTSLDATTANDPNWTIAAPK